MGRNTRVHTHTHLCGCAHAQPKVIDWKFLQTKLISQSTEPLPPMEATKLSVTHEGVCICARVTVHRDECVWMCVKQRDEARHDEIDIDMLTRAKESCEKYLISTMRPLLNLCVFVCVCV